MLAGRRSASAGLSASNLSWLPPMRIHQLSADDAVASLNSSPHGLSSAEALRRLAEYGPNRVEEVAGQPILLRFLKEFTHFFALILWLAAALAFLAEWSDPGQGMMLAAEEVRKRIVRARARIVTFPAPHVTCARVADRSESIVDNRRARRSSRGPRVRRESQRRNAAPHRHVTRTVSLDLGAAVDEASDLVSGQRIPETLRKPAQIDWWSRQCVRHRTVAFAGQPMARCAIFEIESPAQRHYPQRPPWSRISCSARPMRESICAARSSGFLPPPPLPAVLHTCRRRAKPPLN